MRLQSLVTAAVTAKKASGVPTKARAEITPGNLRKSAHNHESSLDKISSFFKVPCSGLLRLQRHKCPFEKHQTCLMISVVAAETQGVKMSLYVLRLRNGDCVIMDAMNEREARERTGKLATSEVATIRPLGVFAAQFALTDEGELQSTILDQGTVAELNKHEYPMLEAARSHSYVDFDSSETDSKTERVLFDAVARHHAQAWDKRTQAMILYAVEQERLRCAN
jgi:hypothetical protein